MRRRLFLPVAALSSVACAAAAAEPPASLAPLRPTTVTHVWRVPVPLWTTEREVRRERVYAPTLHPVRIGYALPEFRSERRVIGVMPEFSCKYPDSALPNECRLTWQRVYAEVPVALVQHDERTFDVPQWSWQDVDVTIEVPRLAWKEETLVVLMPATAATP